MFNQKLVAAIDSGSHNCRLQIAKKNKRKIEIIYNFSRHLSLAENLAFNNEFDKTKIKDLLKILKIIDLKIKEFGVTKYRCVATEAFRQSINSNEVINKIKETIGLKIEVISVREEVELCFRGCSKGFKKTQVPLIIFDIGGGSTEIMLCCHSSKELDSNISFISVPYGVVNLDDNFQIFSKEKIRNKIENEFKRFNNEYIKKLSDHHIIGSCATITTICGISLNLSKYDKKIVEGKILSAKDISSAINKIQKLNLDEKINHPLIGKDRHSLLDSGVFILELLIKTLEIDNLYVMENKVRLGILDQL